MKRRSKITQKINFGILSNIAKDKASAEAESKTSVEKINLREFKFNGTDLEMVEELKKSLTNKISNS